MAEVVVYSKVPCPYCVAAKRLLDEKGVAFKEIDLTGKMDETMALMNRTGLRTLPQIFINDKLVGGYTDLADLDSEGKLDGMLK